MQSTFLHSSHGARRPPPLWFVTNGEVTVGPVRTSLLQRGVWFRRIPEDCLVRELTWRTWRPLGQIREVRAVRRALERGASAIGELGAGAELGTRARLGQACDGPEVLTLALHESCEQTQSSFGMVHRAWDQSGSAFTSVVHGLGMTTRLGREVPAGDAVLGLAHFGGIVVAPPDAGNVERCIARRFGSPADLGGVAMVPVTDGQHLLAVIELGKISHSFRSADVDVLARVARSTASTLRRLAH